MLLGSLLAQLQDEAVAFDALLALDDLVLVTRVRAAAGASELTMGEYVSDAIGRFIASGDDEVWLGLMTAVGRAADPGQAALRYMLEHSLRPSPAARGAREPLPSIRHAALPAASEQD